MAQQFIVTTPGSATTAPAGGAIINSNFTELYARAPGIGPAVNYAPAAGAVDPGAGIAGFSGTTGRLKVTLAGATQFAGLPAGNDAQQLIVIVVAGAFLLTLTAAAVTAGKPFMASASINLQLNDAIELIYDGGLAQWIVVS